MSMETDFIEEEVVENPTLKAAYNLAPLHQNQPLKWDYEVDLIGKKVFDKVLHLCETCELPILVYGRLLPCKHIFCFSCARKCEANCKRCPATAAKVQKVEELALGTVYACPHGAPKHSTKGCRRTYLSQRDLQSHIAHRHMAKPPSSSESNKTNSNSTQSLQLQHPLTQQQAAAATQMTSSSSQAAPAQQQHSQQANLLPSMSSSHPQVLSSSQYIHQQQQHQHQHPSLLDGGLGQQLLTPGSLGSSSTSPAMSQPSPGMGYNVAPSQINEQQQQQGIYRPVDMSSVPHHQFQQQQQQQLQHPHHLLQQQQHPQHNLQLPVSQQQQQQQQPQSQMMRHSGSPGMPPMSKPMLRFPQSPALSLQGSHAQSGLNPFQTTTASRMSSSTEMRMSTTQMHHQQQPRQNINLHQQHMPGMMTQHARSSGHQSQLPTMQKSYDEMQSDRDDYERGLQKMDNFGSSSNDGGMQQTMDNFGNSSSHHHQQRKLFNPLQDLDDRDTANFNTHPPTGLRGDNNSNLNAPNNNPPPSSQGGLSSRSSNVNLITVPIQDEGQYRPLPYVSQSQLLPGASSAAAVALSNKSYAQFSNNPLPPPSSSNFSSVVGNPSMGGGGGIRPPSHHHRMPFSRPPGNPQSHLSMSGADNSQSRLLPQSGNNPNTMLNNQARGVVSGGGIGGGARLPLGGGSNNMPLNVHGGGGVQTLARGGGGRDGSVVGGVPPLQSSHNNPRFNTPTPVSGHWSMGGGGVLDDGSGGGGGNVRPIQPRMPQNLPSRGGAKGDGQFKSQGYYR